MRSPVGRENSSVESVLSLAELCRFTTDFQVQKGEEKGRKLLLTSGCVCLGGGCQITTTFEDIRPPGLGTFQASSNVVVSRIHYKDLQPWLHSSENLGVLWARD